MKLMPCPLNGPRNIDEFVYGGVVGTAPDPAATNDREWAEYLFIETNARGVVREWWYHVPTAFWFIAERDTASDTVLNTYPPGDVFAARDESGR
jgi:sarcosine oxidase subunit delta